MNRAMRVVGVLAMSVFLAGCVASSKYNKLMAEQTALQQEQASLKTQLEKTAAENAELKASVEKAQAEQKAIADEKARIEAEKAHIQESSAASQQNYDAMVSALKAEVEAGNIKVKQYQNVLTVEVAEKLFFASGSATLKKAGKDVLKKVAEAVAQYPDKMIRIAGHTDNVPLAKGAAFASNWELSTARATNVVRFLQDQCKVDPQRLVATGRGEFSPVAPNDTPEGRQKNRRIEISMVDRSVIDPMRASTSP